MVANNDIAAKDRGVGGFTLIELLLVMGLLSMMAGIILPSAAAFIQRNRLEQLNHDISMLCRETFEQAVFSGKRYAVEMRDNKQLVVLCEENFAFNETDSVLLRPVQIPAECSVEWPAKGWHSLPEGFCETPVIRISDIETKETFIMRIRAYDASLIKESAQFSSDSK